MAHSRWTVPRREWGGEVTGPASYGLRRTIGGRGQGGSGVARWLGSAAMGFGGRSVGGAGASGKEDGHGADGGDAAEDRQRLVGMGPNSEETRMGESASFRGREKNGSR